MATVIVVSWLIASVEYAFQVPANRIGYGTFSGYQLKIIQEAITLAVFAVLRLAVSRRDYALEPCARMCAAVRSAGGRVLETGDRRPQGERQEAHPRGYWRGRPPLAESNNRSHGGTGASINS